MRSEEIQQKLNKPSEVFTTVTGGDVIVHLVYPLTREDELKAYATELSKVFKDAENAIEINRESQGLKYNLSISSTNLGTPLFFGGISCLKSCYDDLLSVKKESGEVKLGFYFYQKKVEPTTKQIQANAKRLGDDQAVIEADDSYYVNIAISIEGSFNVKSDDHIEEEAGFVDLRPEVALAVAASIDKPKEEKQED